jgi:hypothetical protein
MNVIAFLSGRRGEIRWEKQNMLGAGGRLDYDCYEAFGFMVPLYLRRLVHTSGWGQQGDTCNAIELRSDRSFAVQAFLQDWCSVVCIIAFVAAPILAVLGFNRAVDQKPGVGLLYFLSCISLTLAVSCVVILIMLRRANRRHRRIRLVLGTHEWGSSDPATWHDEAIALVKPPQTLNEASFESLARRSVANKQWPMAMCAARICCRIENQTAGESITDEILADPQVSHAVAKLEKAPGERHSILGPPISISLWIDNDPRSFVFLLSSS